MAIESILLIDDDQDDRDLFCDAVAQIGATLTCYCAPNGTAALQGLSEEFKDVQLIVLDVNMPGMTGWDTVREIKKHLVLNEIPVLMYSTTSSPKDFQLAIELGAIGLISKPNTFSALLNLIRIIVSTQPAHAERISDEYSVLQKA